jgi:hypothetical protein
MDFWNVKLDFIFKSPFEMIFFFPKNIMLNEHVFLKNILAFICMNFMSFFKIFSTGIHHDKWH